jgi:histidinol-phosphate aminotransferase
MVNIEQLIRPHIKDLVPYSSARDDYSGTQGVFLDANENSFGSVVNRFYRRYPDPYQIHIKQLLSSIKNIPDKNIFLGNGSDEAIDLAIRLFCNPGKDSIIITTPTYGMYEVSAKINEIDVISIPLTTEFQLKTDDILAVFDRNPKMLFLCIPNNPSGNSFNKNSVLKLINAFPGIIVIDEAYSDFSDDAGYLNQLKSHKNLIILQTFSKAWGMAGLRLGIAYAHEDVIRYLNKIKQPYNINQATQKLAVKALSNKSRKDEFVKKIKSERTALGNMLKELSVVEKVFPTEANFFLVRFTDSGRVFRHLIKDLVIVRDRSKLELCGNSLRITVGTPFENKKLIASIKDFEKKKPTNE